MNEGDGSDYNIYGKHSPQILRHQLIRKLLDEYLECRTTAEFENPSIQRFHGALLFVDISGFTALSVRLSVEDLKNHINEYFTKMLNIVDKFGGDVVKFAGDALYIIWRTHSLSNRRHSMTLNSPLNRASISETTANEDDIDYQQEFDNACRYVAQKAVSCALEISQACCNHEIQLDSPATEEKGRKLLPSLNFLSSGPKNEVVYLNVHSGVAMGLMAGIDVGGNDRWEYFLIGDALSKVAFAESQAEMGDVVISPDMHALIHPTAYAVRPTRVRERGGVTRMSTDSLKLTNGSLKIKFADTPLGQQQRVTATVEDNEKPQFGAMFGAIFPCGCGRMENGYARLCQSSSAITTTTGGGAHVTTSTSPTGGATGANNHSSNHFGVSSPPAPGKFTRGKSRAKLKIEDTLQMDDELTSENKLMEDILAEIHRCFHESQYKFDDVIKDLHDSVSPTLFTRGNGQNGNNTATKLIKKAVTPKAMANKRMAGLLRGIDFAALLEKIHAEDALKRHFTKWVSSCLLDDIAKHVHEVPRSEYHFKNIYKGLPFLKFIETHLEPNKHEDTLHKEDAINGSNGNTDDKPLKLRKKSVLGAGAAGGGLGALKKMASNKNIQFNDTTLDAELRSVLVMFIKIDMTNMELFSEHNESTFSKNFVLNKDPFNFITRTANEIEADNVLLQRIQCCLSILTVTFSNNGGHMRQFIVDDKGTVCIGTFGLRGAVSEDNAAVAIETAKQIIIKLQGVGMRASIGVTSGKAYCGLVGSPRRHEYAVMGPSTNLSARLMCKAPPCGIICDVEVKNRDRTHVYETLAVVVAKGYKDPVPTFRPVFKDLLSVDFNKSAAEYASLVISLNLRSSFDGTALLRMSFIGQNSIVGHAFGGAGGGGQSMKRSISMHRGNSGMTGAQQSHDENNSKEESAHKISTHSGTGAGGGPAPKAKLMKQLTRADFFHKKKLSRSNSNNTTALTNAINSANAMLRGREKEIHKILEYCLAGMLLTKKPSSSGDDGDADVAASAGGGAAGVDGGGANGVNNTSGTGKSIVLRDPALKNLVFDFTVPSKMIALVGPQGIGKGSIMSAITRQIFVMSKQNAKYNINMFKNQRSSVAMNVPFYAWKSIIREMLILIPRDTTPRGVSSVPVRRQSKITNFDDVGAGLDYVLSLVPPALRELKPLLAAISFIPPLPDNDSTATLSGQEKLNRTADLLTVIVQMYASLTKSVVIFAMEEIQTFDVSSLQLLYLIWSQNTGTIILASLKPIHHHWDYTSTLSSNNSLHRSSNFNPTNNNNSSNSAAHNKHPFITGGHSHTEFNIDTSAGLLEFLLNSTEDSKFMKIDISKLDREAMDLLIKDALAAHGMPNVPDSMIAQLSELSGCNPLYGYELAKTVSEQAQINTSPSMAGTDNGTNNGNTAGASAVAAVGTINTEAVTKLISSLRSNRIEEVICHRFDQFDASSQMVLKMAAVACANEAIVSFDMLAFIMEYDETAESGDILGDALGINNIRTSMKVNKASMTSSAAANSSVLLTKSPRSQLTDTHKTDSKVRTNLFNALLGILSREEMLVIVKQSAVTDSVKIANMDSILNDGITASLRKASLTLEDAEKFLINSSFEFHISMEQLTIYDLLLDDQKLFIHERVALYHSNKRKGLSEKEIASLPMEILCEEGFHWQHASMWSEAMLCYTIASNQLQHEDGIHSTSLKDLLSLAYKMFISSCRELDLTVTDFQLCVSELQTLLQMEPITHENNEHEVLLRPEIIRIEELYLLANGDCSLLQSIVKLHITYAAKKLLLFEDMQSTSTLLEVALQMVVQLAQPYLINETQLLKLIEIDSFNGGGSKQVGSSSPRALASLPTSIEPIYLANHTKVCLELFSLYIDCHTWSLNVSDEQRNKVLLVIDKYLEMIQLTAARGGETYAVHEIQARIQIALFLYMHQRQPAAVEHCGKLFALYNAELHHKQLIQLYGVDKMPLVYAISAQYQLLQCNWVRATEYLTIGCTLLKNCNHLLSAGHAVIAICATLTFLHKYKEALEIYNMYTFHSKKHNGFDIISDDINKLMIAWLTRMTKYNENRNNWSNATLIQEDSEEIDAILEAGCLSETVESGKRPLFYDFLYAVSIGLETLFSELCLLKNILLCNAGIDMVLSKYIIPAHGYSEFAFNLVTPVTAAKLQFNKVRLLLLTYTSYKLITCNMKRNEEQREKEWNDIKHDGLLINNIPLVKLITTTLIAPESASNNEEQAAIELPAELMKNEEFQAWLKKL